MTRIFIILIFLFGAKVQAAECGEQFASNPRALQAIAFLQSVNGYYKGENCEVSINVCAGSLGAEATMIGEVLVSDKSGRDLYLPVEFKAGRTERSKSSLQNGPRMFHYEYYDNNKNPGVGSYEAFLFEAVKTPDLSRLEYVEFGIRTEGSQRIFWSVCRVTN